VPSATRETMPPYGADHTVAPMDKQQAMLYKASGDGTAYNRTCIALASVNQRRACSRVSGPCMRGMATLLCKCKKISWLSRVCTAAGAGGCGCCDATVPGACAIGLTSAGRCADNGKGFGHGASGELLEILEGEEGGLLLPC